MSVNNFFVLGFESFILCGVQLNCVSYLLVSGLLVVMISFLVLVLSYSFSLNMDVNPVNRENLPVRENNGNNGGGDIGSGNPVDVENLPVRENNGDNGGGDAGNGNRGGGDAGNGF